MSKNAPVWVQEVPEDHGPLRYHVDLAEALRRRPGIFRLVGTYAYRGGATNAASTIRRGGTQAWRSRPGGHYEAKARTTEDGAHEVYARWIAHTTTPRSAA